MKKVTLVITLFYLLAINNSFAQNALAQLYNQQNYEQCIVNANTILAEQKSDSTALFYKGICFLKTGQAAEALPLLIKAEANQFQPQNRVKIARAKCLVSLNQKQEAIQLLDSLVAEGFSSFFQLDDELLHPLLDLPAYQAIRDSVHIRAFPCLYDDRYNHFDFWLGEWNVFVGSTKVGENIISKQNGGCMILEQYTTARDYVGQSTNFFDPHDGLWKQIWIDKTQGISKYVESERKPGYLQFITTAESSPKNTPTYKMTFELQKDGSVTQDIEQKNTTDGEWQMIFQGIYRKKS